MEHGRAFLSALISLEPEGKVSLGVVEMLAGCLDMHIYVFVAREHAKGGLAVNGFEGIPMCVARLLSGNSMLF